MFTEKMARITAEFAGQILEALRASAAEELSTRRATEAARTGRPAGKAAGRRAEEAPPKRGPGRPRKTATTAATSSTGTRVASASRAPAKADKPAMGARTARTAGAAEPTRAAKKSAAVSSDMIAAANRYFASRGNKGATATQLAAHLAELGHDDSADVVSVLTERGAIRDAGFRRSTGQGNKTSAVFVSA
ncbi:MAG: hypothetical protein JWP97_2162 [Labilithrix sp.]|nr:hypothetical protein [Labilithrix sp.]